MHLHPIGDPLASDPEMLARLCRRGPSLILISRQDVAHSGQLQRLIEALDCPIVVVR